MIDPESSLIAKIEYYEDLTSKIMKVIEDELMDLHNNGGNNKGNVWATAYNRLLLVKQKIQALYTPDYTTPKYTKQEETK